MSDELPPYPVELELELPKIALAGEWIPVLVQAKRSDNHAASVINRNVDSQDKWVQIHSDFLDRDTEIRPGETYRFTMPVLVPTQGDLSFENFKAQVHEIGKPKGEDRLVPLPKKQLRVRPSLGKDIKIVLEPICSYAEGIKA